jgi:SAM-dependent methyltransferase
MTSYYDVNAARFVESTRGVDMTPLRARFLAALPQPSQPPARLLDAGTGSGRDALAFRQAGYRVAAFDAAPAMVRAAREHAGIEVRQMRFETFHWPHRFEGIWACAALLHVAQSDLPGVLERLAAHLVPGGVLYASLKLGTGERDSEGRRFTDMTEDGLRALLVTCPALLEADLWRTQDRRSDHPGQIWLNALLRKA